MDYKKMILELLDKADKKTLRIVYFFVKNLF